MEDEEREYIRRNLTLLVECTNVDESLLICLVEKNTIAKADQQNIKTKSTPIGKSAALYEILQTRKDGFKNLLDSLRKAGQEKSGAYIILANYSGGLFNYRSFEYNIDEILDRSIGKQDHEYCVFKGVFGKRDVAVKKICYSPKKKTSIGNQIVTLNKVDSHVNILQYFTFQLDPQTFNVLLVVEKCRTDLKRFWSLDTPRDIAGIDIVSQITCGLAHLHNKSILHLNLRPSNILLSYNSRNVCVKISNFAHARSIQKNEAQPTISRPEILKMREWLPSELLLTIRNKEENVPVVRLVNSFFVNPPNMLVYCTHGNCILTND